MRIDFNLVRILDYFYGCQHKFKFRLSGWTTSVQTRTRTNICCSNTWGKVCRNVNVMNNRRSTLSSLERGLVDLRQHNFSKTLDIVWQSWKQVTESEEESKLIGNVRLWCHTLILTFLSTLFPLNLLRCWNKINNC